MYVAYELLAEGFDQSRAEAGLPRRSNGRTIVCTANLNAGVAEMNSARTGASSGAVEIFGDLGLQFAGPFGEFFGYRENDAG